MKLGKLADIKSGLVLARKAAISKTDWSYRLLNIKSVNLDGKVNITELDNYNSNEQLSDNYLTRAKDILVRLTSPYTAICIDKRLEDILISSYFCIIRLNDDRVLPEYLKWYLNSDYVKKQIMKNAMGTTVSAVRAGFFSDLNIKIPPKNKQELIISINNLCNREIELVEKLKIEKMKLHKKVISEILRKI